MLGVIAAVWFAAAYAAGAAGWFTTGPGEPPIVIGVAAGVSPLLVGAGLLFSQRVKDWADGLDLGLLINLQGWRIGGFVFVAFWAQGLLPAGFALPAGIGDVVIAALAPFVAVRRKGFVVWTAFGILDLVTAVSLGVWHSFTEPSMEVMGRLPLSLIPAFGVPFLLVVHLLSLRVWSRGISSL
ncbi:hypothetical protein FKR81_21845 [Lentzea tibetensis]|uniref:Uncharacterized protein n=1 Tax=Lentzea tibetensis TaxID=2591470 RepID=A0A563ERP9_9PSEU|nr:hypothetical protein [Lentzea tibetensis]TWP50339.1 hypothetical protein FKR81_21845 [Lentzea tibetensis]